MRRTLLLLGAAASAAAFSASPMSLRGSAPARAVSRSGATAVKMDVDPSLIIATLPGLAALGLSLQQGSQGPCFPFLTASRSLVLSLARAQTPLLFLVSLALVPIFRSLSCSLSGTLWRSFPLSRDTSLLLSVTSGIVH